MTLDQWAFKNPLLDGVDTDRNTIPVPTSPLAGDITTAPSGSVIGGNQVRS